MRPQLASSVPLWRVWLSLNPQPSRSIQRFGERRAQDTYPTPCLSALNFLGAVGYMSWWSHLCLLMGVSEAESPTLPPLLQ